VPRLGDFHTQHPNIKLFIAAAYGYFDPARREFNLAIEMIDETLPSLHSEVPMEESLVPVCSPEYLAKHEFLKEPKDLGRCTLLHDGYVWVGAEEDAGWRHWLQEAGAVHVDSKQDQFFSLANLAIEAALTHQGVALGRDSLIRELLDAGQLVMPLDRRIKESHEILSGVSAGTRPSSRNASGDPLVAYAGCCVAQYLIAPVSAARGDEIAAVNLGSENMVCLDPAVIESLRPGATLPPQCIHGHPQH
jgi:DNA-binding transcriptional LysR family regulator